MAGTAGCGRSDESEAAERAQDACIGALEPVAAGQTLSAAVLDETVAHADAAAEVDPDRWSPLRARARAARAAAGSADMERSIDALVQECERVNEVVRRGGKEDPAA